MGLCTVSEQVCALGAALGECGPLHAEAVWAGCCLAELWKSE